MIPVFKATFLFIIRVSWDFFFFLILFSISTTATIYFYVPEYFYGSNVGSTFAVTVPNSGECPAPDTSKFFQWRHSIVGTLWYLDVLKMSFEDGWGDIEYNVLFYKW